MPLDTTAAEAGFSIDKLRGLFEEFDPAALLPELDGIVNHAASLCRFVILVGPVLLLAMGLAYLFFPPKEANWYYGYKTYFGMGSVPAWKFTQKIAGMVLGGIGLILTVVMLIQAGGLVNLDAMGMVWKTVRCLLWEAGLALFANVLINFIAMFFFTRKGEPRRR